MDYAQLYVEIILKKVQNNVMMEILFLVTVVRLLVKYKHAVRTVLVKVGYFLLLMAFVQHFVGIISKEAHSNVMMEILLLMTVVLLNVKYNLVVKIVHAMVGFNHGKKTHAQLHVAIINYEGPNNVTMVIL
jgi:hypothetical protein